VTITSSFYNLSHFIDLYISKIQRLGTLEYGVHFRFISEQELTKRTICVKSILFYMYNKKLRYKN